MFSNEIKELISNIGGRYIIVEDGEPRVVFMSWSEYKDLADKKKFIKEMTEEELNGGSGEPVGTWPKADEVRAYTRTLKHHSFSSTLTDTLAHISTHAGGARAAPNS